MKDLKIKVEKAYYKKQAATIEATTEIEPQRPLLAFIR